MRYIKTIFHILNISLIIFYLFPGSIFGWFFYDDLQIQPQITRDFIVSSNHVYAFSFLAFIGMIYKNNKKKMFIYLIFLGIILELLHYLIPNRSFQYEDLLGNLFGVTISIMILKIILFFKEKCRF
tara:strand:- start:154 stop:531 length:378 start_codon:yes stop_codon:yes gene_type:complete